ncbi:serine/threonine-protein kinase [Antrihabitans spumae]|uniref:non-specific serine/threonine protein kinase n=1 Tax=Antrihabitans spumae TaxID=3373370 RepID=A0ABW7KBX9_9NOCA
MGSRESRVGSRFGPYELRTLLGKGGMGEVYEAYDTVKDRTVAVKILFEDLGKDPTYQERFRRESHSAARLQEPHVIPIHDWGEIDGVLYIDMRLVRGQDLRSLLRQTGPLSPARAVAIVGQIAAALDAAHADNLIHRDVKPENILITGDDFAYLVDFGIVRSDNDSKLTSLGETIGSYAYMAPERFDDVPTTGGADVYSLACVLYECLTGSKAFGGTSVNQLIRAHVVGRPPVPSRARTGIPIAFDDVIARGMAKEPIDRYRSAGELSRAAYDALSNPDRHTASEIVDRSGDATTVNFTDNRTRTSRPAPRPAPRPDPTPPTRVNTPAPQQFWPTQTPQNYGPASSPMMSNPMTSYPPPPPVPPSRNSNIRPVLLTLLAVAVLALLSVGAWFAVMQTAKDDSATSDTSAVTPPSETTELATQPDSTDRPTTTAPRTNPTPATQALRPLSGSVSGADEQGFIDVSGARCNDRNQALAIGRTPSSTVVVCRTGVGRMYYKGVRSSDGASIALDDPQQVGAGFVVVNKTDGTQYRIDSSSLTIVQNGEIVASEPMVEYASR